MTGDPLDRIEAWARDTLAVATVSHARDVLALVEVARAARENADKNSITYRLRAALARLDGGPE